MTTDRDWENWGRQDPYFGVITQERFRLRNLDAAARQEFFQSGHDEVRHVMAKCRAHLDPAFEPKQALDFGCGVGRVAIPLAAIVAEVTALDVAPSMLEEAQRNCAALGVHNVKLERSTDDLSAYAGRFDLVHSCIVLQHIPAQRGQAIFNGLLGCLRPGGIGAIQFTYAKAWFAETLGRDPNPPAPLAGAAGTAMSRTDRLRALLGRHKATAQPAADGDPGMQMNSYELNTMFFMLQTKGVTRFHTEFTDHGGELGVFLYFQIPKKK